MQILGCSEVARSCVGHLVLVHAEGALRLVKDGLAVLLVILLARGLVCKALAGALLAVRNGVTLDLVAGVGDTLLDLLNGRLGAVWGHLVTELCDLN